MKKQVFTAVSLFVIDAFVMNQGAIAAIALLAIVFWLLPKSAFLKYKGKSPKATLTNAVIYSVMALAILITNFSNNKVAESRAKNLIAAIEKYHQSTGNYPEKLTDLVPSYISSVPMAKYVFLFNEFRYINYQGNASLFYVALPPFGRPTYDFNHQSWGYLD